MIRTFKIQQLGWLSLLLLPASVYAHPGHEHYGDVVMHSFSAGLAHPWSGFDHLLLTIVAGAMGIQMGRWGTLACGFLLGAFVMLHNGAYVMNSTAFAFGLMAMSLLLFFFGVGIGLGFKQWRAKRIAERIQ